MIGSFRVLTAAAVLTFCVSCATARCGPSRPGADQALLDFEHRWIDALLHKDVRTLDGLLADDFLDNAYNGNVYAKKEILARLAQGGPTFPSLGLEETRVRVHGDTGIVTGVNVVKTDGGPVRVRFTDVFRREGCEWRAVSAQETVIQPPQH
ncbi:MAG TPA: nuclear transport factor 2 family protein [Thermoanaerobaculia bacterium]|nr:nuclear transport factor 2 family protein [Thermoanaerobaculia bacterium]